jgi:hypothetical protein
VTHGSYNYFFTRPHATQHPQGAAQYLFHAQPDAGFSAITATASTVLMLPSPGLILTLVGMYGLMFLTYKTADKPVGILSAFCFHRLPGLHPGADAECVSVCRYG